MQLAPIEQRRDLDSRRAGGLSCRGPERRGDIEIEVCVTPQVDGGQARYPDGGDLRMRAQPRECLLRAPRRASAEMPGISMLRVPVSSRRGQLESAGLRTVDDGVNVRPAPCDARVDPRGVGP